jgi:hypothetical protein
MLIGNVIGFYSNGSHNMTKGITSNAVTFEVTLPTSEDVSSNKYLNRFCALWSVPSVSARKSARMATLNRFVGVLAPQPGCPNETSSHAKP